MDQTIINFLLGGLGAVGGFLLNSVWQAVRDLQAADTKLAERVGAIEVLVAGQYVTREDFGNALDRVFAQLDAIDQKLDDYRAARHD